MTASVNCHVWSLRPISPGDRPGRTPGRLWETRAGAVELRIPKLRKGSYFPGFAETRRTDRVLVRDHVAVVQDAYKACQNAWSTIW